MINTRRNLTLQREKKPSDKSTWLHVGLLKGFAKAAVKDGADPKKVYAAHHAFRNAAGKPSDLTYTELDPKQAAPSQSEITTMTKDSTTANGVVNIDGDAPISTACVNVADVSMKMIPENGAEQLSCILSGKNHTTNEDKPYNASIAVTTNNVVKDGDDDKFGMHLTPMYMKNVSKPLLSSIGGHVNECLNEMRDLSAKNAAQASSSAASQFMSAFTPNDASPASGYYPRMHEMEMLLRAGGRIATSNPIFKVSYYKQPVEATKIFIKVCMRNIMFYWDQLDQM